MGGHRAGERAQGRVGGRAMSEDNVIDSRRLDWAAAQIFRRLEAEGLSAVEISDVIGKMQKLAPAYFALKEQGLSHEEILRRLETERLPSQTSPWRPA